MVSKEKLIKAMKCYALPTDEYVPETMEECKRIGCPYAESPGCEEEIIADCYKLLTNDDVENKNSICDTINAIMKDNNRSVSIMIYPWNGSD